MAKKSSKTPRRTSPSKTHGVINGAGEVVEQPIVSTDRKSTPLNSSHIQKSRMPSSA